MKSKLILLLTCITLVTFSCKKDSAVEDKITPPATTVKLLTRIIQTNKSGTTFTTFTYNDQKQLTSSKAGDDVTTYLYKDGLIYKTVKVLPTINVETEFEYENKKIRKATVRTVVPNVELGIKTEHVYGYVWSGDNVVEIDHNQNFERTGVYTCELTGNNVTKIVGNEKNTIYDQDFTYDNKQTIYANSNARMVLLINENPLGALSANNILSSKQVYRAPTNNPPGQYISAYIYDVDGFPISNIRTSGTTTTSETKFTYEYAEF